MQRMTQTITLDMASHRAACHDLAMQLRIKEMRKARGWTQVDLAKRAGITQAALSLIESGKQFPSGETLLNLADAFGAATKRLKQLSECCLRFPHRTGIDSLKFSASI